MQNIRIIPRLDIKGPNLVKGIHLEGLRVLGKPEQFAKYYYENGADELVYQDVVASLYNRNSLHDMITRTAKEIFIPLTVGGGLRTIDDIKNVLRAGADKVSINTAALKNPNIIQDAARKFGSSTIVVAIEAILQPNGKYFSYTDNGRNITGIEVEYWARRVEELGAGEIFLTSVDRDGTGSGYDINLIKMVSEAVSIPVIAHGGAGKFSDISEVLENGKADAIAMASMLHYDFIQSFKDVEEYEKEGNVTFLKSGKIWSQMESANIGTVKKYLTSKGFDIRECEPHFI